MQRKGFREQVQAAMSRRHLQLGDVASKMGTTLGYASRVWNDPEDKISVSAIEKFADAVGIDPVEIDLYVEKMLPTLAREAPGLTALGRDLLKSQRGKRRAIKKKVA